MRLLIASQNYNQENNGQAVFARRLAEGLATRGHTVTVLTPSPDGPARAATRGGVEVHEVHAIPLAPFYPGVSVTVGATRSVADLLAHARPQCVHIQDHFPLCGAVAREAARRGIPLVGTNHFMPQNIIPFVPVLSRFESSRNAMERFMWSQVLRVFRPLDAITSPTPTAAALLADAAVRSGAGDLAVRAISCGIDLERFHPGVASPDLRRKYGIDENAVALFFVGRVDREKRLDVMIDALSRLRSRLRPEDPSPRSGLDGRPGVQLVIGGTGRDVEALRAQARPLGDRVRFTGFVDGADLPGLLRSIDIFVMPSEAELQSIATLEAMASARPLLGANAGALPELIERDVNGLLFESGDAEDAARKLSELLSRRPRWSAMGIESVRRARRHGVQATMDRYEELYQEVLDRRAGCQAA
jgi:glycosyltransferase involved in cell wall biosynthesis